jgi:hypothetical protein
MKKLLFIFSILFLISCSPDKFEIDIKDREAKTTLELVNLAKADTNIYHVVVKDNDIYVLNKDYVVEKKLVNKGEVVGFFSILTLILLILCLLILIFAV